jgi:glycosyltransferase involved in cell wall biosynthesis
LRSLAAKGLIRFLGHVSDDDLQRLYAGAAGFVFASRYEGFGLPPLEAMACGVPTLVSDRASLPEVTGNAAWTFDPDRTDDTAAKIEALLDDGAARADLGRRGRQRAAAFTWEACAQATLAAYNAAR